MAGKSTETSASDDGQPSSKRLKSDSDGDVLQPSTKRNGNHMETSVGRPRYRPGDATFVTQSGLQVIRRVSNVVDVDAEVDELLERLDRCRGCIFESAYEYPGRYARWTMGFVNPPLVFESFNGPKFAISALNDRGKLLLQDFYEALSICDAVDNLELHENSIAGTVQKSTKFFTEEERSKQNSIFSVIRAIIDMWKVDTTTDPQLGLYGAFGYDLTFQFESIKLRHERDHSQRDLVLYIPDDILVHDKQLGQTWRLKYEFCSRFSNRSTEGLPRSGEEHPVKQCQTLEVRSDHEKGEYSRSVEKAREEFRVGNLFECVLSQTFYEPCDSLPSEIFGRLRERNPSPYMFVINLGQDEILVGASPEMFVRVEETANGTRVETCPISGTIKRGVNPLEDAERIREILSSKKEESELTMCTDVDRNDKSRICKPGSVQVIGRRQIEKYSKLIHTVDHVEGYLRDGFDALDAFLVHTWAVTVTGCPKAWAIQFIENNEKSARAWYGGAVGLLGFDGGMNTGLTLRTIRIKSGVAEIRAGATLLYDSVPEDEEKETELKASAFREAVLLKTVPKSFSSRLGDERLPGRGKKIILIDHEDSFVNTLASYFRETGADVSTVRFGITEKELQSFQPDLVVLSPGPGNPSDFKCSETLSMIEKLKIPAFGVCLGLQAMVEYFGGTLDVLGYPVHGKPAIIKRSEQTKWGVLEGDLPEVFTVARYHSLYARRETFPSVLNVTAETADDDKIIMGIEHSTLPFAAVQFHPESIITGPSNGLKILANAVLNLVR